ncbi:MAG TPA: hypothetical protein VER03_07385 [Bryobacteraceae bacterium]|nr:hypothetical protein [Bryobacteraceae bacterium]
MRKLYELSPARRRLRAHRKNRTLVFDESVTYKGTTVPASDYVKASAFFDGFLGAQGNAIVLVRQP